MARDLARNVAGAGRDPDRAAWTTVKVAASRASRHVLTRTARPGCTYIVVRRRILLEPSASWATAAGAQLQGAGERIEHTGGHAGQRAAFELGVVLHAHPGQRSDLTAS